MNGKKAKFLRNLTKFNPKEERQYSPMIIQDYNGNPVKLESTKVAVGTRADYRLLKKWVKGEDVILPNHLQGVVE